MRLLIYAANMCLLVFAIVTMPAKAGLANEPIFLGVLNEPQCEEGAAPVVRPVFVKTEGKWLALNTKELAIKYLPKRVHWTATMANKDLGDFISVDGSMTIQPAWTYPRDYRHVLEAGQAVPDISNINKAFGGWCEPPQHRPLVLVSQANFSNPEHWKQSSHLSGDFQSLFLAFKRSFNGKALCLGLENPKPYRFDKKDVRVVSQFVASDGSKVVGLKFVKDAFECGSELGDLMNPRWFYISKSIRYIGTDISLIDIADYDNNGTAEFIFWYSGYNRDGYVLFSDHFRQHTDFTWNYH